MPASGFITADSPFLLEGCYVKSRTATACRARTRQRGRRESTHKVSTLDTLESLWASLTPALEKAKEDQEHADLPIVGTVESTQDSFVKVRVWKRGEDFLLDRPIEAFSSNSVVKISRAEFQKLAKQPWMQHKTHQLQLKGEGNDEDMPISLIAYNNKLINDLLNRTYNNNKNKTSGALNPIDDPFSGIREELRQLTMDGLGGFRLKKRKHHTSHSLSTTPDMPVNVRVTQEELRERSFLRERGHGMGGGGGGGQLGETHGSSFSPAITGIGTIYKSISINGAQTTSSTASTVPKSHIRQMISTEEDATLDFLRKQLHIRKQKLSDTMYTDGLCLFGNLARQTPDFTTAPLVHTQQQHPITTTTTPTTTTPKADLFSTAPAALLSRAAREGGGGGGSSSDTTSAPNTPKHTNTTTTSSMLLKRSVSPPPTLNTDPNSNTTTAAAPITPLASSTTPGGGMSTSSSSSPTHNTSRVYIVEEVLEEGEFICQIIPLPKHGNNSKLHQSIRDDTTTTSTTSAPNTPSAGGARRDHSSAHYSNWDASSQLMMRDREGVDNTNNNSFHSRKQSTRSMHSVGGSSSDTRTATNTTNTFLNQPHGNIRFRACLAALVVPHSSLLSNSIGINVQHELEQLLLNKEIEAQTYGFSSNGVVQLNVEVHEYNNHPNTSAAPMVGTAAGGAASNGNNTIIAPTSSAAPAAVVAQQHNKTWVQAKLVSLGMARVNTSLLSHSSSANASSSLTTQTPHSTAGSSRSHTGQRMSLTNVHAADDDYDNALSSSLSRSLEKDKINKLLVFQERAIRRKIGLWAIQSSSSNFLVRMEPQQKEPQQISRIPPSSPPVVAPATPITPNTPSTGAPSTSVIPDPSSSQPSPPIAARSTAQTFNFTHNTNKPKPAHTPLPIDETHMQDTTLPALFDYNESSQDFRNLLPLHNQRALLSSSGGDF